MRSRFIQKLRDYGTVRGIALDVLEIIYNNPGVTGGEVYLLYKKLHPAAKSRSRNELAKRISDLRAMKAVEATGRVRCPESGRMANGWTATGVVETPVKLKGEPATGTPARDPVFENYAGTKSKPGDDDYVVTAEDVHHLTVLKRLRGQCETVETLPLVPGALKRENANVKDALTYIIDKFGLAE